MLHTGCFIHNFKYLYIRIRNIRKKSSPDFYRYSFKEILNGTLNNHTLSMYKYTTTSIDWRNAVIRIDLSPNSHQIDHENTFEWIY